MSRPRLLFDASRGAFEDGPDVPRGEYDLRVFPTFEVSAGSAPREF
jgi:hypothetical protein